MAKDERSFEEKTYGKWAEIFNHFLNDERINTAITANGRHVLSPLGDKKNFRFHKNFETMGGLSFAGATNGMSGVTLISRMTGDNTKDVARKIHKYFDGQEIDITDVQERIAKDKEEQKIQEIQNLERAQKSTNTILSLDTNQNIIDNYLNSRGLSKSIDYINDNVIKGVDSLMFDKKTKLPAIVAQVQNNKGDLLFLHRTFLDENHQKTKLEGAKKVTSKIKADAYAQEHHIKVNNAKNNNTTVHIAEGIETALAVAVLTENKAPVFSTVNTGGMTKFNAKNGVKNVIIWADNDVSNAGMNAANKLKERLTKQGLNVEIHLPRTQGHDFLDALNSNQLDYQVVKDTQEKSIDDNQKQFKQQEEIKMKDNKKVTKEVIADPKPIESQKTTLRQRWLKNIAGSHQTPNFIFNLVLSIGQSNDSKRIALINAINKNTKFIARLTKDVDINKQDKNGNNLLMHAISAKNLQAVNILLEKDININVVDVNKNTALIAAIESGNNSIAQAIINKGKLNEDINLNAVNKFGDSALSLAVKNNNTQLVETLLQNNANASIGDNPIILSAQKSKEMLALFANQKVLAQKDNNGKTALMNAITNAESTKTVKNLIVNMSSKDLNIQDNNGKTALMSAINMDDKSTIKLLIDDSNINIKDDQGQTALMYAIKNENIKSVKQLINNHADVNLQDKAGNTALIYAVKNSNKAAKKLIKAGVDVDIKDQTGNTALIQAAKDNNVKAIMSLVAAGADISIKNKEGKTAQDLVKTMSAANVAFKAMKAAEKAKISYTKTIESIDKNINKITKQTLSPREQALTAVQKMQERSKSNERTRH